MKDRFLIWLIWKANPLSPYCTLDPVKVRVLFLMSVVGFVMFMLGAYCGQYIPGPEPQPAQFKVEIEIERTPPEIQLPERIY